MENKKGKFGDKFPKVPILPGLCEPSVGLAFPPHHKYLGNSFKSDRLGRWGSGTVVRSTMDPGSSPTALLKLPQIFMHPTFPLQTYSYSKESGPHPPSTSYRFSSLSPFSK